jgi:hypothetical protein
MKIPGSYKQIIARRKLINTNVIWHHKWTDTKLGLCGKAMNSLEMLYSYVSSI